ncbi:hypothetical protein B0H10DRAFT_1948855 [Mycena sp. CBHHK59/15]|nr:hypothetical protein B0H10DRAFT_1948855 [Mycena sp. CBHHK59/15]
MFVVRTRWVTMQTGGSYDDGNGGGGVRAPATGSAYRVLLDGCAGWGYTAYVLPLCSRPSLVPVPAHDGLHAAPHAPCTAAAATTAHESACGCGFRSELVCAGARAQSSAPASPRVRMRGLLRGWQRRARGRARVRARMRGAGITPPSAHARPRTMGMAMAGTGTSAGWGTATASGGAHAGCCGRERVHAHACGCCRECDSERE